MTTNTADIDSLRREFRKTPLEREEQNFLSLLATLGLAAWCLLLWGRQFPPMEIQAPKEEPLRVARVLIEPPPKEEEKEPEPPPLPPRVEPEPPKPAPAQPKKEAAPPRPAPQVKAEAPAAPKKRQVASMGLLSVLSSQSPRENAPSQRIGPTLRNVEREDSDDLSEDIGSLTGTVGAREKATVGEMVAGLPRGTGTKVVLEGDVVTPVEGPGGAEVSGAGGGTSSRTFGEIRSIVAAYIPGLKYLYDRELKRNPSLHGKVTVQFVVTGPGRVTNVKLMGSALGHPGLEGAILSRIQTWKFPPKPGDATLVTFPFDFVPPAG